MSKLTIKCPITRPKQCQSGNGAGQWPWAQSSLHLRGPASAASARLQLARAINFLQAPDLAYSPKIEIVHRGNRTALFVSSDATRCADHYGMLRYGRLQRVVSRLQVKVWSALAAGHRVGESERKWSSMEKHIHFNICLGSSRLACSTMACTRSCEYNCSQQVIYMYRWITWLGKL